MTISALALTSWFFYIFRARHGPRYTCWLLLGSLLSRELDLYPVILVRSSYIVILVEASEIKLEALL